MSENSVWHPSTAALDILSLHLHRDMQQSLQSVMFYRSKNSPWPTVGRAIISDKGVSPSRHRMILPFLDRPGPGSVPSWAVSNFEIRIASSHSGIFFTWFTFRRKLPSVDYCQH